MDYKKLELLVNQCGREGLIHRYKILVRSLGKIIEQLSEEKKSEDASSVSDAVIIVNDIIECLEESK
ncbi:hypothetical protein EZS27_009192 [termite gut metagenome]|uniref:Uncharacterized protein n=1 Tax=termite gut metagenome TaxID=433724 RepID=A0A5J4SAB1_9ZZZZ